MTEDEYFAMNRKAWDQRVALHIDSSFYDLDGFLAGNTSLREIELLELNAVENKSLLHLQCHFGMDTLSWARLGAEVTGVDISPAAIVKARELAQQTGLDARFACSDVYSFQAEQKEAFDIVFTSYGALCWLPDLERWAKVVADNMKPGGTFYIVEFHPLYDVIAGYSYFTQSEPDVEEEGTYTENGRDQLDTMATWAHPLSEVINALVKAGISIEQMNEYAFSPYNCFAGMVEREPGRYAISHQGHDIPLVYSISGKKAE